MNDEQKQQAAQDKHVAGLKSASMRDSATNASFIMHPKSKDRPKVQLKTRR